MTSIIFASVPIHGHVTPLLPLAAELVARGDRVRFLTGSRFAAVVAATGAEHVSLPDEADFDDRFVTAQFPEREQLSPVKAVAHDLEHIFVRPGAAQYAAVTRTARPRACRCDRDRPDLRRRRPAGRVAGG